MKNELPYLSVIVPVYHTAEFLADCLESILNQTYPNLEVIVVDDGSPDHSNEIINRYLVRDERVRCIHHEVNRGLFQARLTGVAASHGKYIAFVDSDDYISIDWFRRLVCKAEETRSDIVVGDWYFQYPSGKKEYLNFENFRLMDCEYHDEEVLDAFMKQRGLCFSWHTIWNKIYTKQLWNECVEHFNRFSKSYGHMTMCEDIVYSCGLWAKAKKVVNVHHAYYIYRKSGEQVTAVKDDFSANCKKIEDTSAAFLFFEKMLIASNRYDELGGCYQDWKNMFSNLLYDDLKEFSRIKDYSRMIREGLGYEGAFIGKTKESEFFYSQHTTVDDSCNWEEDIYRTVSSKAIEYVSLDLFDTLLQRPFFEPTDLFCLLEDEFHRLFALSSYVDFAAIRVLAEQKCRQLLAVQFPSCDEITLDEIYEYISKTYGLESGLLQQIKQREIELELRFCRQRKSGREIFALALLSDKKIIIASDSYLPKEVVEELLSVNGYTGYEKLYLSSELRLGKWSKRLFEYMIKDLGVKNPQTILHIGDNWESDVLNPRACLMQSRHLAKATMLFENANPGLYSGELYASVFQNTGFKEDVAHAIEGFLGLRCMMAVVANKIFDNPHVSFHPQTDFNMNPYYIGYATLGPHLLAVACWLYNHVKESQIPTIHFAARDGMLLKQAYDILTQSGVEKMPSSNYLKLSRKSLAIVDIDSKADFYSMIGKLNIFNFSPEKLQELFEPMIPPNVLCEIPALLKRQKIFYDKNFQNRCEYEFCIKIFAEQIVDFELLRAYKAGLKQYFSSIVQEGDVLFDVGYSGRIEAVLTNLLGYPVNSYYIHSNSEMSLRRQQRFGFKTNCFYDRKPSITGVMREHMLMEAAPSTIGYVKSKDGFEPQSGEYTVDFSTEFMTKTLQNAALDFVSDYVSTFEGYEDALCFRGADMSLPFEYYLHYSKGLDREIFSLLKFEDDFGEGKELNALEFWNGELHRLKLNDYHQDIPQPVPNLKQAAAPIPHALSGLYQDGLFMALYRKLNQFCPKGSKKREYMKKLAEKYLK